MLIGSSNYLKYIYVSDLIDIINRVSNKRIYFISVKNLDQ